eukprot:gnl/MRDRNA2_/MRDRNA2_72126_c0_seq1.p2 gnl/MRDRNA2_/MRDRNA2_72126_c0~~gnl/MRDRNA2_/MRDRNA2_72126_c0_seq1.p2  ORF type:complete len:143 (+),score=25.43 gnl/MRDRNA2_/MRDRNA2_72126_c0_seq1:152-580(+)
MVRSACVTQLQVETIEMGQAAQATGQSPGDQKEWQPSKKSGSHAGRSRRSHRMPLQSISMDVGLCKSATVGAYCTQTGHICSIHNLLHQPGIPWCRLHLFRIRVAEHLELFRLEREITTWCLLRLSRTTMSEAGALDREIMA